MAAWFVSLAFWFGPHVILFHKLTAMTPADFVPIVQSVCVPAVREIKIYQRDHGKMPSTDADLSPKFRNPQGHNPDCFGMNELNGRGGYSYWAISMYEHNIEYDFTPGHEGWTVHGAFANGPVPVPPVSIGPTDQP
jgi:hypothetical protein